MKIDPKDYIKLGYKVANVFLSKNPHLYYMKEDIESEAMVGICKAAKKWVDQGKIKFSTYCATEAQHQILDYLRNHENKWTRVAAVGLEDLTLESTEEGETISWEDVTEGIIIDTHDVINRCSEETRKYLELYNEGVSRHEMREAYKVSWRGLGKLKQSVRDELVEKLGLL